jgi:hypothetical protein
VLANVAAGRDAKEMTARVLEDGSLIRRRTGMALAQGSLNRLDRLFSRIVTALARQQLQESFTMFTMFHVKRVHDHPQSSTIIRYRLQSSMIARDHPCLSAILHDPARSCTIMHVVRLN